MVDLSTLLLANAALIAGALVALWLVSLAVRDASIIDMFWGFGFVLVAGLTWWLTPPGSPVKALVAGMTVLWGLRLTAYLVRRNWGHGEDKRYTALREKVAAAGGNFAAVSLVRVYLVQGVAMWVVSLPVQVGQTAAHAPGPVVWAGVGLWALGLAFEAVGDWQLARFKADPANRGKIMDRGLWRYTRHPNYFGDACVWWGIALAAAAGTGAWWVLLSPAIMTVFLVRVTGKALLEKDMAARYPAYADYVARTSGFIPWPPG